MYYDYRRIFWCGSCPFTQRQFVKPGHESRSWTEFVKTAVYLPNRGQIMFQTR